MTAITPVAFATGSYNASSTQNANFSLFSKISDGTAYTVAAGDFIAVWIVHSGTATRTLAQVTAAGVGGAAYSPINPSVITSSDTNVLSAAGSYRFVTTDTAITLPGCAANTNSISWIALLFQNIDTTTPLAGVTPTTASAINGAAVDCPSITTPASPSGCTVVGFGGQAQSTGAALTAPTTTPFDATARYTGFVNNTAQTNDSAAGYGIKTGLGVSTAFNPSAFNGGTTANTDAMGALSFILKPSVNTFNDTLSESVTGSDSMVAAATMIPTIAESVSGADSNAVVGTMNPAYNESLTVSDSMAGGLLLTKTISESVTSSDALANLVTWGPTLAESLIATESMAALLTAIPAYNEALIASDSLAPNLVMPTNISEAVAAADNMAVAVTFNAPLAESLTGAFALAAIATMVPTLSESVTAADALVGGFVYANSINESVTSADSLTAGAVYNASITESLTGAAGVSGARVTVLRL